MFEIKYAASKLTNVWKCKWVRLVHAAFAASSMQEEGRKFFPISHLNKHLTIKWLKHVARAILASISFFLTFCYYITHLKAREISCKI